MATQGVHHHLFHSIDPVVFPDCAKSHEEDAAQTLLQLHRPTLHTSPSMSSLASQLSTSSTSSSPTSFSSRFSPACLSSPSPSPSPIAHGTQLPPLHFIFSSDHAYMDHHPHPALPPIDRRMFDMDHDTRDHCGGDNDDSMSDDQTILALPTLKRKKGMNALRLHDLDDDSSDQEEENRNPKLARPLAHARSFSSARRSWRAHPKTPSKPSAPANTPAITIVDFTQQANKNTAPLSKPRWQESERLDLLEAIVQDKQLDDMSTFRWDRISLAVGRAKKACKDQWRREVLPALTKSLKNSSL